MLALAKPPAERPRPAVLIIDDSAVARAVLSGIVERDGRFEVADAVPDAASALSVLKARAVDLILLDLEMPGIHGLQALPAILERGGKARVLVVSSACAEGAAATIDALAHGAADTLVKPAAGGLLGGFSSALVEKLARLSDTVEGAAVRGLPIRPAAAGAEIVVVGASTGGIHALAGMLEALPTGFDTPMLITQHLPLAFSRHFAAQVAVFARRPCRVAEDHMELRRGEIMVAPGDAHVIPALIGGRTVVRLSRAPMANGCLPSVDPMFSAAAIAFGARALGVVLSGMGRDGALGAAAIREAGGTVIVQDEESSVVWGMPKAVFAAGNASQVLSPAQIGRFVAGQGAQV